jgi:hypothetical protein
MSDIWDDAATRLQTTTPQPPQPQSGDGDIWDQAASRPIPPPLNLGNKNTDQSPVNLSDPEQLGQAASGIPAGIGKALASTVHAAGQFGPTGTVGSAINLAHLQGLPEKTENPINTDINPNTPEGTGEALGAGLEGVGEFVLGDEALKGLTLGDKYLMVGKIHKALETAPKVQRALELGMQSMRQGAVAGGVALTHGATPSQALESAGVATLFGLPVGQITHWTPEVFDAVRMAQENKYVKTPADLLVRAVNPPEEVALSGAEGDAARNDYAKFDKELKSNLPYLIGTSQETGLEPKGRRDLIDLSMQTADKFHSLYQRDILAPVQDVEVMAKARIPNYQGAYNQDTGTATLRQLDTRLNDLNDMLFKNYERGKGGLPSEAAVGAETELRREASSIRKVLYGELQNRVGDRLGVNVAEIKTRNGQLRDVADTMERRWQQARGKAAIPLGDVAPTPYRAAEASLVRGKRALLGDPRDNDIRAGWQLLKDRGDTGLHVSLQGPSVPPPTNAFMPRTPGYKINIPERGTDIIWEGSTPEEISAQKTKVESRANVVKGAREQAAQKIERNKSYHGSKNLAAFTKDDE